MSIKSYHKEIIEIGRRMYARSLISGTAGNLSIRVDSDRVLITNSGTAKGFLEETSLCEVDLEGNILTGESKPSSELAMHLIIYRNRPDIMAVCHAHPPYATAFSVCRQPLRNDLLPELISSIGKIALAAYAPPGTDQLAKSLQPYIESHNAFLLANHGVVTIGNDLITAYNRMETVEHLAKIIYIANRSGDEIVPLDKEEIKRLENL